MENLEIFKGVVSDETYAKLEEETKDSEIKLVDLSKGEYVSKAKYEGLKTDLANATNALANKAADYDTLKAQAGDNQALKDTIEQMKTAHDTEIANLKAEHQKSEKRSAVVAAISSKYHPKDVNDIMPHLDMDKISIDGNNVIGLSDQLDPLKESKSYLFEEDSSKRKKGGYEHGDEGGDDDAALRAAFGIKDK